MWLCLWDGRSPQGVPVVEEGRDGTVDLVTRTWDLEGPPGAPGKSRAAVVGETLNSILQRQQRGWALGKKMGRGEGIEVTQMIRPFMQTL